MQGWQVGGEFPSLSCNWKSTDRDRVAAQTGVRYSADLETGMDAAQIVGAGSARNRKEETLFRDMLAMQINFLILGGSVLH